MKSEGEGCAGKNLEDRFTKATCERCNEFYIIMTARTLHEHAREHIKTVSKHLCGLVFGDPYGSIHPNETQSITFVILKHVRRNNELHRPHRRSNIN